MRSILTDILAQVRGIWARLDGGQRLVVSAVLIATIAGLGGIVWFAGRPSYQTVYSPKSAADIASVKQALQQSGISWTIGDDGQSFMVERSKVGQATMAIAEAGLTGVQMPAIGGGASLIEDSETKTFRLDAAVRAQAEAAIRNGLDGVLGVTVTASIPHRAVAFRDREQEQKATATVVLRLRPGCDFNALARSAALLASSQLMVPFDNVEVTSATGGQRWKHDADRESGGGTSDSFLALQQKMSNDRTQKAQERLDQLWPGKTSVAVTLELDPQWEVRSEKVLPDSKVVRSEKTTKNSAPGGGTQPGDAGAGAGAGRKDETIDREFVTDIGERRTGKMMPDIKRMSVAVIYDPSIEQPGAPIRDDLINTVKAIVGWDPQRDPPEAFSTMVGTFAPVEVGVTASDGPGIADAVLRWGPTIGQILGVFVVVMFLRGMFKRTPRAAAAAAGGGGLGAAAGNKPEVDESSLPPEEQQKRMRREIERTIASDPAALAKMLESWLTEQKA